MKHCENQKSNMAAESAKNISEGKGQTIEKACDDVRKQMKKNSRQTLHRT
jgi:hypothetical protein